MSNTNTSRRLKFMANVDGTRERLLKAAARAIESGGESAVRIREIASECGVTAPSIYHFFGSREGLIEAALGHRYVIGSLELGSQFSEAVFATKSKKEFVTVVHSLLARIFDPAREPHRRDRTSVLGSARVGSRLAGVVVESQQDFDRALSEPLRFAQSKGWIRDDFDPDTFGTWLTGLVNARLIVEIDPQHRAADEWDTLSTRSICAIFGIPEPSRGTNA